jgi:hypothetical protein
MKDYKYEADLGLEKEEIARQSTETDFKISSQVVVELRKFSSNFSPFLSTFL